MKERGNFWESVNEILTEIGEDVLSYDESEFWMIQSPYEYVEFYAYQNELYYTAIALPLARGLHNGDHRKSTIMRDGITYRLPYMIHPLHVCRMLIDLQIPLEKEEMDILLAAALCHDMIEDIPFMEHGKELIIQYHLHPKVYETVLAVSKRKDFTLEEEEEHFRLIGENKLAALIKLSDRGNNVEDLYNRSFWKVHEYVGETNKYFFPMCEYAKEHYPDIRMAVAILEDKIRNLTVAAEILVNRYEAQEQEMIARLKALREENEKLREEWKILWK